MRVVGHWYGVSSGFRNRSNLVVHREPAAKGAVMDPVPYLWIMPLMGLLGYMFYRFGYGYGYTYLKKPNAERRKAERRKP